ncbi:MAG: low molecular weight phosphotyrosine protein phosphatase [Chloroflexi bacterium]|nr:low molecular weight phosphotyrosine protein phosphatase [Chloroflexota bacterium]
MPSSSSRRPRRVLFVCLGNIIRSPLAEALFRHHAQARGLAHKYEVDSAGIGPWHVGEHPDPRMREVAARHGIHYDHIARQIRAEDLEHYDLILAADREVWEYLRRMAPRPEIRRKIRLLREFDPKAGRDLDVPDPYYDQGLRGFERVFEIVDRSVQGLLDALERGEIDLNAAPEA